MLEALQAVTLAAIGAVAVVTFVFLARRSGGATAALIQAVPDRSVRRFLMALAVALVSVILVNTVATGGPGSSVSFAQAGGLRYVVAPIVYGSFSVTVLLGHDRSSAKAPWPLWAISLTVVIILSCFLTPMSGALFSTSTLAQGIVLAGGFVLFYVAGTRAVAWNPRSRALFLFLVLGIGAVTGLLGLNSGLFSALVVPAAIGMLYLAARGVRWWPLLAAAGITIVVSGLVQNGDAIDPSDAQYAQIGIGALVLVLAVVPRGFRLPLTLVGAVVGAIGLSRSSILPLVAGIGADQSDVTLAQRAFETQQVFAALAHAPWTLLFGTGPGGTVDLSAAPDASTLLSSGRVLDAVPTVHLLTSYMLLKFGVAGAVILVILVISMIRETAATMRARRPDAFRVVLVLLVFTGLAQAVPAATFLFSNPLPALALGLLAAVRTREKRDAIRAVPLATRLASVRPAPVAAPQLRGVPQDGSGPQHRTGPQDIISRRGRHSADSPTD